MYTEERFTSDLAHQYYIEDVLSHLEWSAATPRVLAIGSGAIRAADRYVETYGFSRLQIESIALDEIPQREPASPPATAARPQVSDELLQGMARQPYHLIWAADLFDAVDPDQGQRLLRDLLRAITPGGEVVIGSRLSARRLRALAAACRIPATAMTLRRDADGVKRLLHIKAQRTSVDATAQQTASIMQLN